MVQVATTSLFTSTRDLLKSILVANVTDPRTGTSNSRRRWIYRDFPDTTSFDYSQYPIIVLGHTELETNPETLTNTFQDGGFVWEIQIVAEFNDPNSRVDTISDEVVDAIFNSSGQTTLQDGGLFAPKVLSSSTTLTSEDRKQLVNRLIRLDLTGFYCT